MYVHTRACVCERACACACTCACVCVCVCVCVYVCLCVCVNKPCYVVLLDFVFCDVLLKFTNKWITNLLPFLRLHHQQHPTHLLCEESRLSRI